MINELGQQVHAMVERRHKTEESMSLEDRGEKDAARLKRFDKIYYGEEGREQQYLDEVRRQILPVLEGYIGD